MDGLIINFEARRAGSPEKYNTAESEGIDVSVVEKSKVAFDGLNSADGGIECLKLSFKNIKDTVFEGVIHIKAVRECKAPKVFMPGYMYGSNRAEAPSTGRKAFPRLKKEPKGMPESDFFMTRSDRLAEPVSLVYDEGRVFGIAAAPYLVGEDGNYTQSDMKRPVAQEQFYRFCGFSCGLINGKDGALGAYAGYTLGYENAPWLFVQTATVRERTPLKAGNSITLGVGESKTFTVFIYDYKAHDERGVHSAIEHAYYAFRQPPRTIDGMTPKRAVSLLSAAIRDEAWLKDEHMYTGFVYDRPGGAFENKIGSLTWTNGLSVAVPMLMAALKLKDGTARKQSLSFIDEVLSHALNPSSGLLYDAVKDGAWSVRGWWYDGMHTGGHCGYLNGQAVYYILKAYLYEKRELGAEHDEWRSFAKRVIDRFEREKNTDGEYPFSMSEKTGAGLEYDSMGGAWCLAATAMYTYISKDTGYLEGMKKSEEHYFETFVQKAECYGGPLDTDKAVDDEGILAYIRAVRLLHEITGDDKYLERLRDAILYEVSFKLGYNTPVMVEPLKSIGWSSSGGSITSTANPHIHPMSSTIVEEMKYCADLTQDRYIEDRSNDTIGWGLQTFNTYDKEYGYGKPGWMSERFCFCEGLLTEKWPDGSPASTWFALMPWASASIIEGLVPVME